MRAALALAALLLAVPGARAEPGPTPTAFEAWQRCLAGQKTLSAHARCGERERAYYEALKASRFVDAEDVARMRPVLRARAAAGFDPVATGSLGPR